MTARCRRTSRIAQSIFAKKKFVIFTVQINSVCLAREFIYVLVYFFFVAPQRSTQGKFLHTLKKTMKLLFLAVLAVSTTDLLAEELPRA